MFFFCRISFSNVSLMFLWFWHAHLAFCQWYVILRILTWSLLQNEMRKQIVQNIGCTKLEWGQGSTVHSIFQQCHFINIFCFFPNKLVGNECMLHHCFILFFCEVDEPIGVYKMIFRGKKTKKIGGKNPKTHFINSWVSFLWSRYTMLESIKWFFVVKKQKNWGQESQN